MRKFWRLANVQLRGLVSSVNRRGRKTSARAWPSLVVYGLLFGLAFLLSFVYAALAFAERGQGASDLVLLLMPALGLLIAVGMGGQSAGSFVFGGKDIDQLLALPISPTTLAAAKLTALFAENALLMLSVTLATGLAYGLAVPAPWFLFPVLVLGALPLAGLATALSALLGMGLSWLGRGSGSKVVSNVVAMLLMAALMLVWVGGQTVLKDSLRDNPSVVRATVSSWLPPLAWLRDAALTGSPASLGALALVGLVPGAAVTWLVGRSFVPLVSALTARRGGATVTDVVRLRARSPFAPLVRREAQRFFGTTIYFVNTGFGLLAVLAGSVYLLVVRGVPAGVLEGMRAAHFAPGLLATLVMALVVAGAGYALLRTWGVRTFEALD